MRAMIGLLLITTGLTANAAGALQVKRTDFARVIDVTPAYTDVMRSEPRRECWTESVRYEYPVYQNRSATPKILGALIGAAVGNNIAHGRHNRRASRVAGAVLGASIGSDIAHENAEQSMDVEYRDEERCEVRESRYTEQVLVGYDVTYEYYGSTYRTRMDHDPGKRVKVVVSVQPVL